MYDCENFEIPDFRLESDIFFYRNIVDANNSHNKMDTDPDSERISFESYVEERIADIAFLEMYNRRNG